ncbi:hypothetical protein HF521_021047 [Silurus meridionalis]|uniref:Kelch domain-containing protein 2 n=1 Tax=Silurus meridionalis TaxID=175797 RepID=A0A8T0BAB9_SILME|nr:hypothetical protein HF521_021047 [Silurus meridionalis]
MKPYGMKSDSQLLLRGSEDNSPARNTVDLRMRTTASLRVWNYRSLRRFSINNRRMAEQEGDVPDVREELDSSEDEEEGDEERDFRWQEQREVDWFGDEEADLEPVSDMPAERSGHVTVVDSDCMYVWGGYKRADAHWLGDLYLPCNEIWIYNMETERWTRKLAEGDLPNPMSGSCGTCVDGILYLFGGHCARGDTNSVYHLPLRASHFHWERMKDLKGLAPTCKDKLGCWVYMDRIVYFGGYGCEEEADHQGMFVLDGNSLTGNQQRRGWNNHIHILNLETSTWSQPITTGNAPTPRAAHACATIGNRGYVFGGRYLGHRLNDLYYINMDTWEWTEMSMPECSPIGRSWHSFIPISSDQIFLFGGFTTNQETLSDAWIYCVSTNQWKTFKHQHKKSPSKLSTAIMFSFSQFSQSPCSDAAQRLFCRKNISLRACLIACPGIFYTAFNRDVF